jgi:hypothetical protein
MTVKDLIEKLQKLSPDLEVTFQTDCEYEDKHYSGKVSGVYFLETKFIRHGKIAQRPCKETEDAEKAVVLS